jgi:hypothetical protein
MGRLVGPRAGSGESRSPFRESNPGRPAGSLVTILAELPRLQSSIL